MSFFNFSYKALNSNAIYFLTLDIFLDSDELQLQIRGVDS